MSKTTHKKNDPLKPPENDSSAHTGHGEKRLSVEEMERMIVTSDALRRIMAIMINGKRSQGTPSAFLAHPVLMQKMFFNYQRGEIDEFLFNLQLYLSRIVLFTPQTGKMEAVPGLIEEVEKLVRNPQIGLAPVARRILSVLNAPA